MNLPEKKNSRIDSYTASDLRHHREQLSMAFRLAERFGFHEGICNHFSVALDGDKEHYLINPYGLHWSEITPDALLLIDGDGQILEGDGELEDSARFIHVAGHRANPRHKALMHTHMPYTTALTMLQGDHCELQMAHQTAARFAGRIAYEHAFGGIALDAEEGARIAQRSQKSPDVDVVFLAAHGVVIGAPTVAQAFDDLYYLERASRQQILALQTGLPLVKLADDVVKLTAEQSQKTLAEYADKHFKALSRVLEAHPDRMMTF
ncbi:MAG: aldolase [Granulosicoccus sp.]